MRKSIVLFTLAISYLIFGLSCSRYRMSEEDLAASEKLNEAQRAIDSEKFFINALRKDFTFRCNEMFLKFMKDKDSVKKEDIGLLEERYQEILKAKDRLIKARKEYEKLRYSYP